MPERFWTSRETRTGPLVAADNTQYIWSASPAKAAWRGCMGSICLDEPCLLSLSRFAQQVVNLSSQYYRLPALPGLLTWPASNAFSYTRRWALGLGQPPSGRPCVPGSGPVLPSRRSYLSCGTFLSPAFPSNLFNPTNSTPSHKPFTEP
jgi:hypothetical protein